MVHQKKAMAIGQVFVFIIAGLTFALILIFGYTQVNKFLKTGETVQFAEFKTNLENSIKGIQTDYGSVRQKPFHLPAYYEKICFIDLNYKPSPQEIASLCAESQAACDVWQEADQVNVEGKDGYAMSDANVFLKPIAPVIIKISPITISDNTNQKRGFLCRSIIQGSFTLIIEGKGDHTELLQP